MNSNSIRQEIHFDSHEAITLLAEGSFDMTHIIDIKDEIKDEPTEIKHLTENDLKDETLNKPCFDGDKIIDYVLVYKDDMSKEDERKVYLKNLELAGLVLRQHTPENSIDDGPQIHYILVHAPNDKLLEAAEKARFKVPVEVNEEAKNSKIDDFLENFPNPFKLSHEINNERKYFTAPYDSKMSKIFEKFWKSQSDESKQLDQQLESLSFLSSKDRSLLIYEFLSRTQHYSQRSFNENENFKENGDSVRSSVNKTKNQNIKGIERLIETGVFIAAYPLHEYFEKKDLNIEFDLSMENKYRQFLWQNWATVKNIFKYQPIPYIRTYFGEKIAFYFSWLGFYTTWLVVPSVIGFFVFIYGLITLPFDIPTNEICNKNLMGNITMCPLCNVGDACSFWKLSDSCLYSKITHIFDNGGTVFFSIVMALWTVLFIEFWKRQQSTFRFEWDTIDYEHKFDVMRPEYERALTKLDKISKTGEPTFKTRFINYLMSWSVVLLSIMLVLAILLGIIVYRFSIYIVLRRDQKWRPYSSYISSATAACINLIFILVLNRLYTWCAIKLTDIEMHRTDSEYENAFTIKMYLFQFFNYYSSIFYIAFIKGSVSSKYIEPCDPSGCLVELCIQLAIIMVGKQIINNIQEYLYPYILKLMNRPCNLKQFSNGNDKKQTLWQKDYELMSWSKLTLFDEYLEMVIQFGFITLFVVAFPIAPLFAFLNNILEIRIDSHKFLVQMRRPLAKRARDIGIWLDILNSISKIGVITNGLIIAFTSEFIPRLVYLMYQKPYNKDLSGFVNFTLSNKYMNSTENNSTILCSYRAFDEPADSANPGENTMDFFRVNVIRLAFIVVFEHVVFFAVTCLHWFIRDVPTVIKHQIEKENSIIQNAIWDKTMEKSLAPVAIIKSISGSAKSDDHRSIKKKKQK